MWEPGDPLHPHPNTVRDGQTVRWLFDLNDDAHWVWGHITRAYSHCLRCFVAWHPAEGPLCWCCGRKGARANDPYI